MLTKLRNRTRDDSGFTLIELLAVMLILGILAAIAIPAFINQRDKPHDSAAKAGARAMHSAMEIYATQNEDAYDGVDVARLKEIEPTLNDLPAANVTVLESSDGFTVTAGSSTGNTFSLTRATNGQTTSDCAEHGVAGCPSDGNWTGK